MRSRRLQVVSMRCHRLPLMLGALLPAAVFVTTQPADIPSPPADRDLVYVPATLGVDPTTGRLAESVAGQLRQAMENMRERLRAEGTDLSRVVSVNVYLSDTRHFSEMNETYRQYFPEDPPTRATVEVDLPAPGALVQVAAVAARPHVSRRVIVPTELRSPELPYSWGILAGNTLFVAGATSRDPESYQPLTGDIVAQTRRVFGNIGAVLRAADMDYGDIAACTVFLDDPREFGGMNEAYREFFDRDPPARATVRAGLMNPLFKVEVQCVAARGAARSVVIAPGASRSTSPFSPAILVDDRLFLAGMVGRGESGLVPGDVEEQTRQTLANLQATLQAAGWDFGDVNAMQVFVPNILHIPVVTSVVDEIVGMGPSRTTVGAGLMGPDLLVEIMMVASRAP